MRERESKIKASVSFYRSHSGKVMSHAHVRVKLTLNRNAVSCGLHNEGAKKVHHNKHTSKSDPTRILETQVRSRCTRMRVRPARIRLQTGAGAEEVR